jgi:hypothetical protein
MLRPMRQSFIRTLRFCGFKKSPRLLIAGLSCLLSIQAAPPDQSGLLSLDSPKNFQVFQRRDLELGIILLQGRVDVTNAVLEFRLSGPPLKGGLQAAWKPLSCDPQTGAFRTELPFPAGGWYQLEVRLVRGGESLPLQTVGHVGVGEVFVVAGQSNSTNYGESRQKPQSGLVSTFDGARWRIADDPQPGTFDRSSNGSFLPSFGDALVAKYKVPIGVASTGSGATSVRQWLMKGEKIGRLPSSIRNITTNSAGGWEAAGDLFDHLLQRVNALGPHGFRALLWHQGESDAGQARGGYGPDRQISGEDYKKMLARIIQASQDRAGWKFPWFVAQATYHSPSDPSDAEFRDAQKWFWDTGLALQGPDTDTLTGDNRANHGKGVHLSAKGLEAHGKLWAEKVVAYLDQVLGH